MKAKIYFLLCISQLIGCVSSPERPVTYPDSGQLLFEKTPGCTNGEIYNYGTNTDLGYVVMQRCINNLVSEKGVPESLVIGKQEILQCLKNSQYEILVECHPSYE